MVMNIPPIVVGANVGLKRATYANYGEARKAWWQDSLKPLYEHFDDTINTQLAPEFGDNVMVRWDFSNVPALQEEVTAVWDRNIRGVTAGFVTLNEARANIGLPNITGGDVLIRTLNQYEVPVMEETGAKALPIPIDVKLIEKPDPDRSKEEREMTKKTTTFLRKQKNRIVDEAEKDAEDQQIAAA
jgi:hypothetical protein